MDEQIWQNAAQASINAGVIPMPVTGTLLELLQTIMDEKEAQFVPVFTKPMNMREIREKSNLDEKALDKMLEGLMFKGMVTGIPSKNNRHGCLQTDAADPRTFRIHADERRNKRKRKETGRIVRPVFS